MNLFAGSKYSKSKHRWHLDLLSCQYRFIVACAGRQIGKSYTCSLVFLKWFLEALANRQAKVAAGTEKPWSGLKATKKKEAEYRLNDAVRFLVVARNTGHLTQTRNYIMEHLERSGFNKYLHPDLDMREHRKPDQTWFIFGKTAGVIEYLVGAQESVIRSGNYQGVWVDEAGSIDNAIWQSLEPTLAKWKAPIIISGTPNISSDHWFTRLAISGLPADHDRADPSIATPNPEVKTFLGRSDEDAYLDSVREETKKKIALYGANSLLVQCEYLGDWRIPELTVFQFDSDIHFCNLTDSFGRYVLKYRGKEYKLPKPDRIYGSIDWFKGRSPGGALVLAHWRSSPLDTKRGLSIVLDSVEWFRDGYHDDRAGEDLLRLQQRWNVAQWLSDPTGGEIIKKMKRKGVYITDTDNTDKAGRIGLLQRLISFNEETPPEMLFTYGAKRPAEQIERYRYSTKRDGTVTDKFIQYDDCLVDCLAYLSPKLYKGATLVAGSIFGLQ